MLFNVYNYSDELIGQVEADNVTQAWEGARGMFIDVLDVRLVEAEAINMVCVQCGRVYKFKPPEIELGVCICGGTEYTREIPMGKTEVQELKHPELLGQIVTFYESLDRWLVIGETEIPTLSGWITKTRIRRIVPKPEIEGLADPEDLIIS